MRSSWVFFKLLLYLWNYFLLTDANAMLKPSHRGVMWTRGALYSGGYNYMGINCGGVARYRKNNGKCGLCGDAYNSPKRHETGGKYATGTIAEVIERGERNMMVKILLNSDQRGYFEFRLCESNGTAETQACFDKHLLKVTEGRFQGDEFAYVVERAGMIPLTIEIPEKVYCEKCVLQWKYITGNTFGRDDHGIGCLGCGHQETYVNCADITIKGWEMPPTPAPVPPVTQPVTPPVTPPVPTTVMWTTSTPAPTTTTPAPPPPTTRVPSTTAYRPKQVTKTRATQNTQRVTRHRKPVTDVDEGSRRRLGNGHERNSNGYSPVAAPPRKLAVIPPSPKRSPVAVGVPVHIKPSPTVQPPSVVTNKPKKLQSVQADNNGIASNLKESKRVENRERRRNVPFKIPRPPRLSSEQIDALNNNKNVVPHHDPLQKYIKVGSSRIIAAVDFTTMRAQQVQTPPTLPRNELSKPKSTASTISLSTRSISSGMRGGQKQKSTDVFSSFGNEMLGVPLKFPAAQPQSFGNNFMNEYSLSADTGALFNGLRNRASNSQISNRQITNGGLLNEFALEHTNAGAVNSKKSMFAASKEQYVAPRNDPRGNSLFLANKSQKPNSQQEQMSRQENKLSSAKLKSRYPDLDMFGTSSTRTIQDKPLISTSQQGQASRKENQLSSTNTNPRYPEILGASKDRVPHPYVDTSKISTLQQGQASRQENQLSSTNRNSRYPELLGASKDRVPHPYADTSKISTLQQGQASRQENQLSSSNRNSRYPELLGASKDRAPHPYVDTSKVSTAQGQTSLQRNQLSSNMNSRYPESDMFGASSNSASNPFQEHSASIGAQRTSLFPGHQQTGSLDNGQQQLYNQGQAKFDYNSESNMLRGNVNGFDKTNRQQNTFYQGPVSDTQYDNMPMKSPPVSHFGNTYPGQIMPNSHISSNVNIDHVTERGNAYSPHVAQNQSPFGTQDNYDHQSNARKTTRLPVVDTSTHRSGNSASDTVSTRMKLALNPSPILNTPDLQDIPVNLFKDKNRNSFKAPVVFERFTNYQVGHGKKSNSVPENLQAASNFQQQVFQQAANMSTINQNFHLNTGIHSPQNLFGQNHYIAHDVELSVPAFGGPETQDLRSQQELNLGHYEIPQAQSAALSHRNEHLNYGLHSPENYFPHESPTSNRAQIFPHQIKESNRAQSFPHQFKESNRAQSFPSQIEQSNRAQSFPSQLEQSNRAQSFPSQIEQSNRAQSFPSEVKQFNRAQLFPYPNKESNQAQIFPHQSKEPKKAKIFPHQIKEFNQEPIFPHQIKDSNQAQFPLKIVSTKTEIPNARMKGLPNPDIWSTARTSAKDSVQLPQSATTSQSVTVRTTTAQTTNAFNYQMRELNNLREKLERLQNLINQRTVGFQPETTTAFSLNQAPNRADTLIETKQELTSNTFQSGYQINKIPDVPIYNNNNKPSKSQNIGLQSSNTNMVGSNAIPSAKPPTVAPSMNKETTRYINDFKAQMLQSIKDANAKKKHQLSGTFTLRNKKSDVFTTKPYNADTTTYVTPPFPIADQKSKSVATMLKRQSQIQKQQLMQQNAQKQSNLNKENELIKQKKEQEKRKKYRKLLELLVMRRKQQHTTRAVKQPNHTPLNEQQQHHDSLQPNNFRNKGDKPLQVQQNQIQQKQTQSHNSLKQNQIQIPHQQNLQQKPALLPTPLRMAEVQTQAIKKQRIMQRPPTTSVHPVETMQAPSKKTQQNDFQKSSTNNKSEKYKPTAVKTTIDKLADRIAVGMAEKLKSGNRNDKPGLKVVPLSSDSIMATLRNIAMSVLKDQKVGNELPESIPSNNQMMQKPKEPKPQLLKRSSGSVHKQKIINVNALTTGVNKTTKFPSTSQQTITTVNQSPFQSSSGTTASLDRLAKRQELIRKMKQIMLTRRPTHIKNTISGNNNRPAHLPNVRPSHLEQTEGVGTNRLRSNNNNRPVHIIDHPNNGRPTIYDEQTTTNKKVIPTTHIPLKQTSVHTKQKSTTGINAKTKQGAKNNQSDNSKGKRRVSPDIARSMLTRVRQMLAKTKSKERNSNAASLKADPVMSTKDVLVVPLRKDVLYKLLQSMRKQKATARS